MSCFETSKFLKNPQVFSKDILIKAAERLNWEYKVTENEVSITKIPNQNVRGEYAMKITGSKVIYNSYYLKDGKQLVDELQGVFYKLNIEYAKKSILTEFENYVDEETYEKLGVSVSLLDKMSHFLTKNIPIAASRTKLFATILGEKSKEDFIEHMFFGTPKNKTMAYKQQYWRDKDEMKTFNCKISYTNKLWSESENFNLYMYEKTLKFVNNNNLNVVVLLPPYNSELIKKCMKDAFNKNVTWFLDKAVQNGIKSASFIENIDEKYFLDDMHLNADGNRQLAQLISKKIK